jgi:hypothetical protein
MGKIFIRIVCICVGVYRIRMHGKPHPKTRVYAWNHTCLLRGPLLFMIAQFRIVATVGTSLIPFFGKMLRAAETIFID